MSERKSSGALKALVWVVLATGMGVVAGGGFMVLGGKIAGSPTTEDFEGMKSKWGGDGGGPDGTVLKPVASDGPASAGDRPVVAPIEATEAIYQQYMARKDVLVLVEYYADW